MQNLIELSELELDAVAGGAGVAIFSFMVTASGPTRLELVFWQRTTPASASIEVAFMAIGTSSSISLSALTVVS